MIIADIITELHNVPAKDLLAAIRGTRATYKVLPVKLQKEMLSEYSNMEYCLLSAAHENDISVKGLGDSILDMYVANKK